MRDGREGRVACGGVMLCGVAGGCMTGLGEYVGALVARVDCRESEIERERARNEMWGGSSAVAVFAGLQGRAW
jgi:hypothetical protein